MAKYKLAVLTSHPIQYQVPLWRRLSAHQQIDLTVYFCADFGVKEAHFDQEFGRKIQWDTPLLGGYKHVFLKNYARHPSVRFFGQINPGIIREFSRENYDAVFVHGYALFSNWLAFLGAWVGSVPILLRGESQLLSPRSSVRLFLKKTFLTIFFKTVSAFLTIGSLNRKYYEYYGAPFEKLFLVPYAVDDSFFLLKKRELQSQRDELRREIGAKSDTLVIIYVGKIYGAKGPGALDLLKAFHRLDAGERARLVYVGEGKEKYVLEKYVATYNLQGVVFTGFKNQSEIPRYYMASDVFVLPSYSEQWGVVMNEAMYFDNAIIASDQVGAAYDLVREGVNGFVFPVGDVEALAGRLFQLMNDRELLSSMRRASFEIIQKWSIGACVSGILEALKSAVKR